MLGRCASGQLGETGVTEGVAAEQEAGNLVAVQGEHLLAHPTLQYLNNNISILYIYFIL